MSKMRELDRIFRELKSAGRVWHTSQVCGFGGGCESCFTDRIPKSLMVCLLSTRFCKDYEDTGSTERRRTGTLTVCVGTS